MKQTLKDNRIGIMSVVHEGRKPFGMQTYFFEDMVKSVPELEKDLFFFSPMECEDGKVIIKGYRFINHKWTDSIGTIPNIIYDRAFSKNEYQKTHIDEVRQALKNANKIILNPFGLADLLNNKIEFHKFLSKHNISTLGTYPGDLIKDEYIFDKIGISKIYLKPTFGSKGEGIFVIEKRKKDYLLFDNLGKKEAFIDYSILIETLLAEIDFLDNYFIQEEAKMHLFEGSPFDIRVLVQNFGNEYRVTGEAARIGQKHSITSNLNSGGNALPIEELSDFLDKNYMYSVEELRLNIEKLCLECSEVLRKEIGEFCEIGFDILITRDRGPIIIEGNAKPSRWVFVKIADYLKGIGKDNSYYLDRRKETVSVPIIYAVHLLNEAN